MDYRTTRSGHHKQPSWLLVAQAFLPCCIADILVGGRFRIGFGVGSLYSYLRDRPCLFPNHPTVYPDAKRVIARQPGNLFTILRGRNTARLFRFFA